MNELDFISGEIEKFEKSIKHLKEELEVLHKDLTETKLVYANESNILQHQEASILLITRNIQVKSFLKCTRFRNIIFYEN